MSFNVPHSNVRIQPETRIVPGTVSQPTPTNVPGTSVSPSVPARGAVKHAMSIDVEDWYHCLDHEPSNWHKYEHRIVDCTRTVLDIFARTDTRATFFILGVIAEREPKLVEEIRSAGHEIASHGTEHRFVYNQTPEQFEQDVQRSVDTLRAITGEPVIGYRAPFFSITKNSLWALPILKRLGFKYDSSVHPVYNPRYGIPDAPRLPYTTDQGLEELPISTYPVGRLNFPFAGGIYFRAFPWMMLRPMFRALDSRNEPIMFYLHPWELDPDHPRIPLPAFLKARHYYKLDKTAAKLEKLCRTFRFGTISEVINA